MRRGGQKSCYGISVAEEEKLGDSFGGSAKAPGGCCGPKAAGRGEGVWEEQRKGSVGRSGPEAQQKKDNSKSKCSLRVDSAGCGWRAGKFLVVEREKLGGKESCEPGAWRTKVLGTSLVVQPEQSGQVPDTCWVHSTWDTPNEVQTSISF